MRSDLWSDILQLTAEHLLLVLNAMVVAIAIGVPLGIYLTRRPQPRARGCSDSRTSCRPSPAWRCSAF